MTITKSALAFAVTLLADNIAADSVYQGLADSNPDLFAFRPLRRRGLESYVF